MEITERIITENLDLLISAVKEKSITGRGSNKKLVLYGINKIRELILDLAMKGLLVPEDPNDEKASELVKKIGLERTKLIKDCKIKKEKGPISFDGLHEIKKFKPIRWEWVRLSQIADVVRGGSPRPAGDPRFYDGHIPFLKVADITNNRGKLVEGFNSTIKDAGLKKTRFIDKRTVLLSNSGATLGIPAICEFPATFNDGIAAFLEKSEFIYDEYLYLCLKNLSKWFLEVASRGQGQPNLNTDIIKATWIPLPPVKEQKRIVEKVDKLMSLCDQLEKKQKNNIETHNILISSLLNAFTSATTDSSNFFQAWQPIKTNFDTLFTTEHSIDQLKQTILQLAVTGKLVPQDLDDEPASILLDKIQREKANLLKSKKIKKTTLPNFLSNKEDLFNLPTGWEWAPLGIIGNIFNGNSISSDVKERKYTNIVGRPYLSTKDIAYGFESPKYNTGVAIPFNESNFKIASKNSVLICSEGGSAGKKCGIIDREICFGNKLYANQLHGNINPRFILSFYLTPLFYNQFSQLMTGIIGGVSVSKFSQIQCPLPPLAEQSRIIAKIDELLDICEKLKENISKKQNIQNRLADSLAEQDFR